MSNQQVAHFLLQNGLDETEFDGVVFLGHDDSKMVLTRGGKVVPLDRAGIALDRRFAFYDQVRTNDA
jgi:hypothetical protein